MSKSDVIVFPYGIKLREDAFVDVFPAAEVFVRTKQGDWLSLFFVIDSGATISALPRSDATVLGIDTRKGIRSSVSGIGTRPLSGWKQEIPVRLGKLNIQLPVIFLAHPSTPRVLGRAGLFSHFTVIFEEAQKRSTFLRASGQEALNIKDALDKLKEVSAKAE